jgi:hypothetical protein
LRMWCLLLKQMHDHSLLLQHLLPLRLPLVWSAERHVKCQSFIEQTMVLAAPDGLHCMLGVAPCTKQRV